MRSSGGFLLFGAINNPTGILQKESKTSSTNEGLISDKLLDKLYEKGIPVDVDNFVNNLAKFESDLGKGLVNKRGVYALQALANRIIQQADYLSKAEQLAENKESIGEIAVGGRGQLYVIENNTIKGISAAEYDYDKHGAALTVGELIQHRKFNSAEAGDTELTRVINDNIGMSKIRNYIQNIISTVGDAENSLEAYIDLASYIGKEAAKKPTNELLLALQSMNNMIKNLGKDAIFKIKDSEQSKNLKQAFDYISSVLPRDMKIQLIGRNVANGNSYDSSGEYIQSLIAQALYSSNKTKSDHFIDYDGEINKAAGTKSGTTKEQDRNMGILEQLVQGTLGQREFQLISSKFPELSLNLHGSGVGSLATYDNKIVDKTPMSIAMSTSLAPLVDDQHITIGNQKISRADLESILYNGGDVINIWAPVNADGNIDFEMLSTLRAILDLADTNPLLTTENKNQLLQEYGLDGKFDEKGKYHGSGPNMAQFLVTTGVTSDKVVDAENNWYADKLSSQEKDAEFNQIERIYGQLNKGIKGNGKMEFRTGWFNATTDLYRVPIFMRLNQTAQLDVGGFSGKGPIVRTPTYGEQIAYDQLHNTPSSQKKQLTVPTSNALYQ